METKRVHYSSAEEATSRGEARPDASKPAAGAGFDETFDRAPTIMSLRVARDPFDACAREERASDDRALDRSSPVKNRPQLEARGPRGRREARCGARRRPRRRRVSHAGPVGKQQAHGEARHLRVVVARRAVQVLPATGREATMRADGSRVRLGVLRSRFGAENGRGSGVLRSLGSRRPSGSSRRCRAILAVHGSRRVEEAARGRERVRRISVADAGRAPAPSPRRRAGIRVRSTRIARLRRGFPKPSTDPGSRSSRSPPSLRDSTRAGQTALVTRVGPEVHAVRPSHSTRRPSTTPRPAPWSLRTGPKRTGRPGVVVLTAGTTDIGVAEEAALTAELMGEQRSADLRRRHRRPPSAPRRTTRR